MLKLVQEEWLELNNKNKTFLTWIKTTQHESAMTDQSCLYECRLSTHHLLLR
jgi:hypothetical protein